jgi:hypothetical protein
MATSTIDTFLMVGASGSETKLVDIKDYPDLMDAPETLETTTLSDHARTFIEGLQSGESKTFTANYTKADFSSIEALKGVEQSLGVWFGADSNGDPDGHEGKFTFKGFVSATLLGKGVNEVREMQITVTLSSEVAFA